uniref:Uncharacterized protein n=1 Tax=Strombidium rassoulzadegani TaxID=1082188 RepID=A0A7S3CJT5_9SPIT|mmetsp:Transcript_13198/g.22384  ORF Transcript_13198/g.22384 Transcript_13198/m.22384 type:complete len:114 (+) Transcript_13198:817-1158(+)
MLSRLSKEDLPTKDAYRRGIYHGDSAKGITQKLFSQLDKNAREKRGKRDEVKILETKNRLRVKKQLFLIRKFLGLPLSSSVDPQTASSDPKFYHDLVKVDDERTTRLRQAKLD